ncbi:hypothetical protein [Bacillus sp. TL12]|uniref:hypothetical protein n=1 Tax=Bacillus sp. TL12 TaxID=2894756 RepID=UPI001F523CF2|nr:hypothetical protein [Bacillus sp. TL12]MCI0767380.1 hypothetical protein [Bacillus sp. TL12]
MKYKPVPTWEQYEIAEKNGISKVNVNQRIDLGWTIEEAITKPIRVTFRQKHDKYVKLAESNGISFITFRARVETHNWNPEEAATKPVMTAKEAAEKNNENKRIIPKEIYAKARKNGINNSTLKTRILMLNWDMDLAATKQVNKKYRSKLGRQAI